MTFESRDDFGDKSKVIKSAEFAGEVIELVELSIGWRPWHYQVNVKQGNKSSVKFHQSDDIQPENVWFYCPDCDEEYNLPEDQIACPLCDCDQMVSL